MNILDKIIEISCLPKIIIDKITKNRLLRLIMYVIFMPVSILWMIPFLAIFMVACPLVLLWEVTDGE